MGQITIRKYNREITVDDTKKNAFLKQGYDHIDPHTGKVITRATGGRDISVPQYNKLLDEIDELKAKLADGGNAELEETVKELKKENASLKGEITKLKKAQESK